MVKLNCYIEKIYFFSMDFCLIIPVPGYVGGGGK